jgi:hypothetical protein
MSTKKERPVEQMSNLETALGGCSFLFMLVMAELEKKVLRTDRVEKKLNDIVSNPERIFSERRFDQEKDLLELTVKLEGYVSTLKQNQGKNIVKVLIPTPDTQNFVTRTEEYQQSLTDVNYQIIHLTQQRKYGEAVHTAYQFQQRFEKESVDQSEQYLILERTGETTGYPIGSASQSEYIKIMHEVDQLLAVAYSSAALDTRLSEEVRTYSLYKTIKHTLDAEFLQVGDGVVERQSIVQGLYSQALFMSQLYPEPRLKRVVRELEILLKSRGKRKPLGKSDNT